MRRLPTTEKRHFDDVARRRVEVLFEAILPGTDTAPGATDARAADFLDHLLAVDEAWFSEVGPWRRLYASALPLLDAVATERFGRGLVELDAGQAAALVADLAAGTIGGFPAEIDQRSLFATLRGHCIEGCFSDPRWSGNADGVMWRWLGYPAAPDELSRASAGGGLRGRADGGQ